MKRNFELELEAVQALQEQQLTSRDGRVDCSIALMRDGGDLKKVRNFDKCVVGCVEDALPSRENVTSIQTRENGDIRTTCLTNPTFSNFYYEVLSAKMPYCCECGDLLVVSRAHTRISLA